MGFVFFSTVLDVDFVNDYKTHIKQIAFEVVKTTLVLSLIGTRKKETKKKQCERVFLPESLFYLFVGHFLSKLKNTKV